MFQPLLAHVRRIAPGVQLRFQGAGGDTGQKLAALDLDLSLQQADSHSTLASPDLFSDRFVCATWNGNALVNDALTEALFCSLGHIAYVQPSYDHTALDRFARTFRIQAMTDSFRHLPFLLRGTSLIALVHERLGLSLRAAADVRLLACPLPITPFKVSMWWNHLYNKDVAHAWLRSTLIELTADMDAFPPNDYAAR